MKSKRREAGFTAALAFVVVLATNFFATAYYMSRSKWALGAALFGGLVLVSLGLLAYRRFLIPFLHARNVLASRLNEATRNITAIQQQLESATGTNGFGPDPASRWPSDDIAYIHNALVALGSRQSIRLDEYLSEGQASGQLSWLVEKGRFIETIPWLDAYPDAAEALDLNSSRTLLRFFRSTGYLSEAIQILQGVVDRYRKERDSRALSLFHSERALYRGEVQLQVHDRSWHDLKESNVVVHFVGKVLPDTQSGYTLRSHYTAKAQHRAGIEPIIVGQVGATAQRVDKLVTYIHDGIRYFVLPGPQRGEENWDNWLQSNVDGLSEVVRLVSPKVLHAHSDFINATITRTVSSSFGIPFVNETRGFWEESWLSRTAEAWKWDISEIKEQYRLPEMYTLRVQRENEARVSSDVVVTLADVMERHIKETAAQLGESVDRIAVIPNAVEPDHFPIVQKDRSLLDALGIPENANVMGYITSMVEYEGVDTLIRAFHILNSTSTTSSKDQCIPSDALSAEKPVGGCASIVSSVESLGEESSAVDSSARPENHLLLVGAGPSLEKWKALAAELKLENVTFAGQVPHGEILRYYSVIDLFVVPRKAARVTELVTPLKPFEAMSTGRTCLFANVAALEEIAEKSRAAETFEAGNPRALAEAAADLFADPDRMSVLGRRAAAWVREERSWDRNAEKYLELYRDLGMDLPGGSLVEATAALAAQSVDIDLIRESLCEMEDPAMNGWFSIEDMHRGGSGGARAVIKDGWQLADHPPIIFTRGLDWDKYTKTNRSWGFHLHAWEMLDPVLTEYLDSKDPVLLDWALSVALDWASYAESSVDDDSMAWYDMALSLRMARLARLMICVGKSELSEQLPILIRLALSHIEMIKKDAAFNIRNNHGFYCALSQMDFARLLPFLPGTDELRKQGRERLDAIVGLQFADDGGHLEHSPEYHRMLLASVERAIESGLIEDRDVIERISKASHALGWMVQPDGCLVQFGDTPRRVIPKDYRSGDAQSAYIYSDGGKGSPASEELLTMPMTGYAFVRSPQPNSPGQRRESTYVAFMAAFHSRAHKHADDLTFCWFDRGREILVDSGRYGYVGLLPLNSPDRLKGFYYSSPERQYVESTRAHNTVAVDGMDHDRRSRTPYGSALGDCEQQGERFLLRGRVDHERYTHSRRLEIYPGKSLIVHDLVESRADIEDVAAWFNLSGDLAVRVEGNSLRVELTDSNDVLWIRSTGDLIEPVRGGREPFRGWRSVEDYNLEPTWNFGFRRGGSRTETEIETRFEWDT